jgi:pyruvate dehydrogenase E2 component (dihydrolipoamide acetyltransferase)
MAIPVEMPKMSDTMEEGVLVAWLAEEGASVSSGDVIAQVETDKATMDLEVYDNGVLLKRMVSAGDSVPIGALIAVLGKQGEDISALLARYQRTGDGAAALPPPSVPTAAPATPIVAPPVSAAASGRVKASPLARQMAQSHGIELTGVMGSGPEGRIVRRDVEAAVASGPAPRPSAPAAVPAGPYESVRLTQMRKTIARRLAESKDTAPHFYLTVDVAMENASAFRNQLNELATSQNRGKISFNDLISKASALALRQHPYVNASYLEKEGEIRLHREVHVAIAVAIDEGLITPVVRHVDQKGLAQIAEETRVLAERARERKLQPDEFEGSTFTTSNLGMFGIEEFTAIINPPNAGILAIGAIRDVPVVKNGDIVAGKRMKLTLSCDHRVVDGATGAQFLHTVKHYLEEPMNLLL